MTTTESGVNYAGSLYREDNFPLSRLLRKVLSKVRLTDETVESLKSLSEKGVVVYALKNKSQLNSLILRELGIRKGIPQPVYCHGINMTTWQPFSQAFRVILSHLSHRMFKKISRDAAKAEYLKELVRDGKSAIIHLGESELFDNPFVEETLSQLMEVQATLNVPVYLCPELITYGRRREKEEESLINILFGQSDTTDPLRRVITFLRYSNKASLISAEPVNLAEFMNAGGAFSREELVRQLRGELIARIDEEKATIVGPLLKSREEIIGMVLRDRGLVASMEEMARAKKGKRDFNAVRKEAIKYLDEIASDYSEIFVEIWDKVLDWLWNNIYDGVVVDVEGVAKIRNVSKKMPFVIIPCHRSHFDYLLLSHIFYKNNIQMPFVAAGSNLSFFPMGYIFRKSGAFFLRRSFKGNDLYAEVFAKYLKVLLKEGLPLEFFIEGGRSRTGKMVMPKYGLLSMIIQAYQEKAVDDLAAIPVYIGYDRVVEEKAYLQELGGVPKEKERATEMIRSSRLLRRRYGRVYMNVGEPLLLKSYLAAQEKPLEEMTIEERQGLYRRIGYTIVRAINKVSVVTPFALTASGLLCYDRRGISLGELREVLELFYDYLGFRKVSLAMTFADREKAVSEALHLFNQSGLISRMGAEEEEEEEVEEIVYSLEDDKRMNLEYYKNNILHYFLPVSFVATAILTSSEDMVPINRICDDYSFFKRLFRHEFIFDDQKSDVEEVREVLTYLRDRGMIAGFDKDEKTWIEVKGRGRTGLHPFAGLIHNYMESYWVAVRGCYHLRKGPKAERDWLKNIRGLGVRMYRKGEIRRAEALSQSNYQSAIRYLQDVNIVTCIEVQDKKEKRFTKRYVLTDNKVQLESLRRRLFKFL